MENNNNGSRIRFEIQELGPIRDSVIEFKPFMLFAGESNTGKSYTAMAVYYLLYLLQDTNSMEKIAGELFNMDEIEERARKRGHIILAMPQDLIKKFAQYYNKTISHFMGYMLGFDDFKCSVNLEIEAAPLKNAEIEIRHLIEEESDSCFDFFYEIPDISSSFLTDYNNEFKGDFVALLNLICLDYILNQHFDSGSPFKRFYLPPARGAFSGLAPSAFEKFHAMGLYKEYLEGMDSIRYENSRTSVDQQEQKDIITPLFNWMMDGKINSKSDSVSITPGDSQTEIPLSAASSAVKELYPLYQVLNRVPIDNLSLSIEEPETQLNPELQRGVAKLLAYMVNLGSLVQVTTHSDFFLDQVNSLVKHHHVEEKEPGKLDKILEETGIDKESILSPGEIGAYYFKKTDNGVKVEKLETSPQGLSLESLENTYDEPIQ